MREDHGRGGEGMSEKGGDQKGTINRRIVVNNYCASQDYKPLGCVGVGVSPRGQGNEQR